MSELDQIGARLLELRRSYGYKAKDFAAFVGIAETTWNNYERGKRRISLDEALKVASRTGAGMDWIYRGMESSLPKHVLDKIDALRRSDAAKDDPPRVANG